MDHERRMKMAVRSVLLLECLERSGYFPEGSTEEDRDRVLRRLYDFQNSMTFNIHTVYQVGGEVSGDIPLRSVGTAVYSRTVLLNHSCSGNTAR